LTKAAPTIKGTSIIVQYGNGCLVKWDRIIFVVIRPKTKLVVKQKRMRWFSASKVEYGEKSHAQQLAVKVIMGIHSRKTGRTGRLSRRRAATTFITLR